MWVLVFEPTGGDVFTTSPTFTSTELTPSDATWTLKPAFSSLVCAACTDRPFTGGTFA